MNLIKNDNNEGLGVVEVKGRRKIRDSRTVRDGPSAYCSMILYVYSGPSWSLIMNAVSHCEPCISRMVFDGKLTVFVSS